MGGCVPNSFGSFSRQDIAPGKQLFATAVRQQYRSGKTTWRVRPNDGEEPPAVKGWAATAAAALLPGFQFERRVL